MAQGLLGGARVLLNAPAGPELAAVHGVCAQLVFGLLVCLAVLTSPRRIQEFSSPQYALRCRRTALALAALVFLQVVLGAFVRHLQSPSAVRLHVLTAFAVTAGVVWLLRTAWERPAGRRVLGRSLVVMAGLLVLQVGMGIEALLGQYGSDLPPELQPIRVGQAVVRTGHVVVGALILASAAVAVVQAYRAAVTLPAKEGRHESAPEGVYTAVPSSQQVRGTA